MQFAFMGMTTKCERLFTSPSARCSPKASGEQGAVSRGADGQSLPQKPRISWRRHGGELQVQSHGSTTFWGTSRELFRKLLARGTVKETKGQMHGAEIPSVESEEDQRVLMAGSGTSPNPSSLVAGGAGWLPGAHPRAQSREHPHLPPRQGVGHSSASAVNIKVLFYDCSAGAKTRHTLARRLASCSRAATTQSDVIY